MPSTRAHLVSLAGALALIGALAAGIGCGGARAYQPDSTLVTRLGAEEALLELEETLRRAASPPVLRVEVTDEHLALLWMDTRRVSTLRFRAFEAIDIHEGTHVVTIRLASSEQPFRIDFIGPQDAQRFVDLLASFYRAHSTALPFPAVTRNQERLHV